MSFKSCASWPAGTFDCLGNYTEDIHASRESAWGVCQLLAQHGAGGNGILPLKTWVEEIKPDSQKTEADLAAEVFNPDVSDLAYFLKRKRDLGV